jgi:hypothetical protein
MRRQVGTGVGHISSEARVYCRQTRIFGPAIPDHGGEVLRPRWYVTALSVEDSEQRAEQAENLLLFEKRLVAGVIDGDAPCLERGYILLRIVGRLLRALQQ